jgi:hypothetical protein
VVHAELWGIIYGLDLAKKKGHKRVHVEFDSMIAINLIRNGCNKEHPAFQLVQAALRITEGMETILWQDTWREANQVADTLAKYSLSLSNNCKYSIRFLVSLILVMPLRADFDCIAFPRGFLSSCGSFCSFKFPKQKRNPVTSGTGILLHLKLK